MQPVVVETTEGYELPISQEVWEMMTIFNPKYNVRSLKKGFVDFLLTKFGTVYDGTGRDTSGRFKESLRVNGGRTSYVSVAQTRTGAKLFKHIRESSPNESKRLIAEAYQQFMAYPEEIQKLKQKQQADIATGLAPVFPTGVSNLIGKYGATGKARRRKTRKTKKTRKSRR